MRLRTEPASLVTRPESGHIDLDFIRRLESRQARDEHRLFLAEGIRFASAALDHDKEIVGLVYCPKLMSGSLAWALVERIQELGIPSSRASPEQYRILSPGVSDDGESNNASRQGILLVLRQ